MRLRRIPGFGAASGSVAFLVLMLLAVAASVNFADSSFRTISLVAIPLASTLAVVAGIVAYRPQRPAVWYLVAVAQIPMGGITIALDLHPLAVMSHFLLALVVVALSVVVAFEAWSNATGLAAPVVPRWLRLVAVAGVVGRSIPPAAIGRPLDR